MKIVHTITKRLPQGVVKGWDTDLNDVNETTFYARELAELLAHKAIASACNISNFKSDNCTLTVRVELNDEGVERDTNHWEI